MEEIINITDICVKCGETKKIKEFKKCSNDKRGHKRTCKDCHNKETKKDYYSDLDNSRTKNRDKMKNRRKDPIIRQKDNDRSRQFFLNNPNYGNEYATKRYKTDILYRIKKIIRSRLLKALKKNYKTGSAIEILGCSIVELKAHLEKQFYTNSKTSEEMTWDNYGLYTWHIDHIIPLASFDLQDREQLLKACNYTNLQPLWAEENMHKGTKLDWGKKR